MDSPAIGDRALSDRAPSDCTHSHPSSPSPAPSSIISTRPLVVMSDAPSPATLAAMESDTLAKRDTGTPSKRTKSTRFTSGSSPEDTLTSEQELRFAQNNNLRYTLTQETLRKWLAQRRASWKQEELSSSLGAIRLEHGDDAVTISNYVKWEQQEEVGPAEDGSGQASEEVRPPSDEARQARYKELKDLPEWKAFAETEPCSSVKSSVLNDRGAVDGKGRPDSKPQRQRKAKHQTKTTAENGNEHEAMRLIEALRPCGVARKNHVLNLGSQDCYPDPDIAVLATNAPREAKERTTYFCHQSLAIIEAGTNSDALAPATGKLMHIAGDKAINILVDDPCRKFITALLRTPSRARVCLFYREGYAVTDILSLPHDLRIVSEFIEFCYRATAEQMGVIPGLDRRSMGTLVHGGSSTRLASRNTAIFKTKNDTLAKVSWSGTGYQHEDRS